MEELLEILEEIRPNVDFENETALVDSQILSSFDILTIISEISDAFDVEIKPAQIVPANFNSAAAMWEMIKSLQ